MSEWWITASSRGEQRMVGGVGAHVIVTHSRDVRVVVRVHERRSLGVSCIGPRCVRPVSPSSRNRSGDAMGDQTDDEDAAPLANPDKAVAPTEPRAGPDTASQVILSTRTSRAWIGLLPALVVLAVILVFVLQNSKDVRVSLFTFSGTFPLSVALLGAVILGALMTLALGSVRIFQLRRRVRRKAKRSESGGN